MKYRGFILSVLEETMEANKKGQSIDKAIQPFKNSNDTIELAVLSCVMSEKFRSNVRADHTWMEMAQSMLEELVINLLNGETDEEKEDILGRRRKYQQGSDEDLSSIESGEDCGNSDEKDEEEEQEGGGNRIDDFRQERDFSAMSIATQQMINEIIEKYLEGNTKRKYDSKKQNSESEDETTSDMEGALEELEESYESDTPMGKGSFHKTKTMYSDVETRFLKRMPPDLKKLARMIGRSGSSDTTGKGRFLSASKSDIAGITTGDNLSCLLPSEVAMLAEPKTQDIFLRNLVEKRLQVFASASSSQLPERRQDGPVIICLDTTGSMHGDPMIIAKCLTIAVCIYALKQKRKVLIFTYSETFTFMDFENFNRDRRKLINFLDSMSLGGNNEDYLFNGIFSEILPSYPDYKSADLLCITDFGWASITKGSMDLIHAAKEKGMIFYGLGINTYGTLDHQVQEVIDRMWFYQDNVCHRIYDKIEWFKK